MRLLADENIDPAWVAWLRAQGNDVVCIREIAKGTTDAKVLTLADRESRVVLTEDKDYGDLVIHRKHPCAGVVLVRLLLASRQEAFESFTAAWPEIERHATGHFTVLSDRMLRIRLLN